MPPLSAQPENPNTQQSQNETAAERIAKNQAATEAYIKKEYPNENFISSTSELQSLNKRTKKLMLPENVRIAESRADIKSNEQRRTLEKELRQSGILARKGNSVWLTPEPGEYMKRVTDAVVNGVPYEFRNISGNARTLEWEFGNIKEKGKNVNVFINIESSISKNEARRRIRQVLDRHPEYTGKIVVSLQDDITYFWDTKSFR